MIRWMLSRTVTQCRIGAARNQTAASTHVRPTVMPAGRDTHARLSGKTRDTTRQLHLMDADKVEQTGSWDGEMDVSVSITMGCTRRPRVRSIGLAQSFARPRCITSQDSAIEDGLSNQSVAALEHCRTAQDAHERRWSVGSKWLLSFVAVM